MDSHNGHLHDVTPDLISSIARKLVDGIPSSNGTALPTSPASIDLVSPRLPETAVPGAPTTLPHSVGLHSPDALGHAPHTIPDVSAAFRQAGVSHGTSQAGHDAARAHSAPPYSTLTSPAAEPTPRQASEIVPLPWSLPFQFHKPAPPTQSSFNTPTTENDGLGKFVRSLRVRHDGTESESNSNHPATDVFRKFGDSRPNAFGNARPFDVASIRKDFPILAQTVHGRPLVWFDNAATTQKPQSVIDALSKFYREDNSNIHRAAHTLAARATDAFEQARQKAQNFLGASSPGEIVFVRGTTEGINLIAQTYGKKFLQPGDEIVMSTLEHHANIVPWQMVAKEKGAVIRVIPVNDRGEVMLEEYQAILGPRTRIVALTQASNSLGTILPVAEMTKMARRYNARVLIDGAQSVAHLPVNVQDLDSDFFVFSGHKIFGPTGIGVVHAKKELLEIMPPWQGGGSMIKDVTFEETTYSDPPAKFEAGTPNIADAVGLGAALDYVSRLGLSNIAKYEHELLEYATARLSGIDGLRLIGTAREKVSVLSFVLRERRTEDVGRLLDREGIAVRAGHHCSQPSLRRFGVESTVRPSLSIYNTFGEIDRLVDAIHHIIRS